MASVKHPSGLVWDVDAGVGFYQVVPDGQYDQAYWDNYVKYSSSPIADSLLGCRVTLVNKYCPGEPAVDIGIGCGHFIMARGGNTLGYDVNEVGIRWLLDRRIWCDPYFKCPGNATCWDSLEHMRYPEDFVRRVEKYLFVSVPIFSGMDHALRSKHFKPKEHFWYWTRDGFVRWAAQCGFDLVEENRMETDLGREDIGSFVFRRVRA